MKLAIYTDCKEQAQQLTELLYQLRRELCIRLEPVWFEHRGEFLKQYSSEYGATLLDGDLPDCIDAGKYLRRPGFDSRIFLFARDSRVALIGYAVHPEAFLCKPVEYFALRDAFERQRRFWRSEMLSLSVTANRVEAQVAIADIAYIEVCGRTLTIHGRYGQIETRMSLTQVEKQTVSAPLLRCHRSILVNLYHVRSCGKDALLMADGTELPISTDRKSEVQARWQQFREENQIFFQALERMSENS